tara:strand:+ start:1301 stop:2626 length:1326 start_codon:yes stop_codon:yes gene_type:complete
MQTTATPTTAATIGALFSELAVVDNLVDDEEACDLTTRRALACVNQLYDSKMAAFFMRPLLKLQVRDCTQGNANWVNNQLLKRHERVVFRPVLEKWRVEWSGPAADFDLASIRSHMKEERYGGYFTYNAPDDLDQITAFFVGRMLTMTPQFGHVYIRVRDINSPRHVVPGMPNECHYLCVNVRSCKDGQDWFVGDGQQLSHAHWTLVAGTFVEAAKRSIRKWPRGEGGGMLLKGTPIDRPGADWLAGEIRRRDIAVQQLHLDHSVTPISHGMFGAVCDGKVNTKWLRTLSLADNEMLGPVGMKRLAAAAARGLLPALRHLDVSNTCLCDEGLEALAPQFASGRGLCHLTHLDLGHNDFRDAGLWAFMVNMSGMTGLRGLNLYNNQFVFRQMWTKFGAHLEDNPSVCPALVTVHIDSLLTGGGDAVKRALEMREAKRKASKK